MVKKWCLNMIKNKLILLISLLFSINIFAFDINGIEVKNIDGNIVNLSSYNGKKMYLKLWSTKCDICVYGLYDVNKLVKDKERDFEVVTLMFPSYAGELKEEEFIKWWDNFKDNYPDIIVYMDSDKKFRRRYLMNATPTNFLIDEKGKIRKVIYGDISIDKIKEIMKKL